MKYFTANFDNTSITRSDYEFNDIDYLEEIVNDIKEIDPDFEHDDIEITMNNADSLTDGVIKFLSEFDELNYDLMVGIGCGDYDEYWEDEGTKYYQYQYLVTNQSLSAEDAMEKCDQVQVFMGSRGSYAEEFMDDVYDIPSFLINYIDYDAFADDLERDGDITEIEDNVWIVNANSI